MSTIDTSPETLARLVALIRSEPLGETVTATLEALAQSRKEHAEALADAIFALTDLRKQLVAQAITCNGALAAANDLRATLSAAEAREARLRAKLEDAAHARDVGWKRAYAAEAREARLRAELLTVANAMPHTWIQSRALATLANTEATP